MASVQKVDRYSDVVPMLTVGKSPQPPLCQRGATRDFAVMRKSPSKQTRISATAIERRLIDVRERTKNKA